MEYSKIFLTLYKLYNMKSLFFLLFLVLTSCSVSKSYVWDNKKVSKRFYDKKLKEYTLTYVNSNLSNVTNFNVIYDTLSKK